MSSGARTGVPCYRSPLEVRELARAGALLLGGRADLWFPDTTHSHPSAEVWVVPSYPEDPGSRWEGAMWAEVVAPLLSELGGSPAAGVRPGTPWVARPVPGGSWRAGEARAYLETRLRELLGASRWSGWVR